MHPFSRYGMIEKTVRLFREIRSLQITTYAGYASYFMILSVFPALVLVLGLLRYTALEPSDLTDFLGNFLPDALQGYVWSLISSSYANSGRTVVSVSALAALWSAGKGIYGLMRGLNGIYAVTEHRSWIRTRLLCAVYMISFILVLLLTLALHVFGTTLVQFLQHRGGSLFRMGRFFPAARYVLLVAVQTLLFTAVFMYLPDRNNRFRESLPGALFGSLGWMTLSGLFGIYMEHFSGYSSIFGPVYTLALAMLWLYLCVCTLFLGGVLNRWLIEYR